MEGLESHIATPKLITPTLIFFNEKTSNKKYRTKAHAYLRTFYFFFLNLYVSPGNTYML